MRQSRTQAAVVLLHTYVLHLSAPATSTAEDQVSFNFKPCCRCPTTKLATFTIPRDFCDEHWARWWGGYDPELPYDDGSGPDEEMYKMAVELLEKKHAAKPWRKRAK